MDTYFILLVYLLLVNIIGFYAMWSDKRKAKKSAFRIPEKTLFMIAIIGGSVGSIAGMYRFRHKTKHTTFTIGMPLILLIQIYLLIRFLLPLYV